jgi:hypothetical protein
MSSTCLDDVLIPYLRDISGIEDLYPDRIEKEENAMGLGIYPDISVVSGIGYIR